MSKEEISIGTIGEDGLYRLAKFVVDQNLLHHQNSLNREAYQVDIDDVFKEECNFFSDSIYTIAKDNHDEIIGSIRTMKWNERDQLPLEKIFTMQVRDYIEKENIPTIWHIGRFAVKKGCSNISLFKNMVLRAISPICEIRNSVAFAECDTRLIYTLQKLGIDVEVLKEPILYLGSQTAPVRMTGETLTDFFAKNVNLADSLHLYNDKIVDRGN